jgi:hypothetical protein
LNADYYLHFEAELILEKKKLRDEIRGIIDRLDSTDHDEIVTAFRDRRWAQIRLFLTDVTIAMPTKML